MGTIREYPKEDGSISFHAEVRLRGHRPERGSFRTRSLAKKWIQDTESAIRDGRHFKTAEAKKHTVGELIDHFIGQYLQDYPKRLAKQRSLLMWWKDQIGEKLLADLTPSLISKGRDELKMGITLRKTRRSESTVNRYLAALSKALSVAVTDLGWLETSPMSKVKKCAESAGRDRFLSLDEKNRLLAACKISPSPHLYPIVRLALLTGMRFGEIVNLKWEDIDFSTRTITIRMTKNGQRHIVLLTEPILGVLNDCQGFGQVQGGIFQSARSNNKSGVVSIRKSFLNALRIAEIQNFRFHDLRHTAASYLAMNGATQGELMYFLNHRNPAMTKRYAHYSQDHMRKKLEETGRILLCQEQRSEKTDV